MPSTYSGIPAWRDPRAVVFDAGNTLIFADRERIFEIYREFGVEGDEGSFVAAEFLARCELSARVEAGATGTEAHIWKDYFLTLFRESGVPDDAVAGVGARIQAAHAESHLWTHVEPGTRDALDSLRDAGYRLAVISNADGRVESVLEQVGLREPFEFVVDSALVGFEKPDTRIFEEGLRRLGLPGPDAVYVGDLFPVDVVGARRAGMQALLLDPSESLDLPVHRIRSVGELPAWLAAQRTDESSG
jgi:HAD superfamily hydrolase (TIGR01509 family)